MAKIVWLLEETVIAIHYRQISEHGGGEGLRDEGLLSSAMARPRFSGWQPSASHLHSKSESPRQGNLKVYFSVDFPILPFAILTVDSTDLLG